MVPFTSKPTSRNLRLPLTSLLAGLLLLFLLISGAAAMFLLNQNQDIRQQASTTDTTGGVYGVKNCSFGVADGAYYCDSASKSVIRKCDNGTLSIVKSCGAGTECSTSGSCKNSPTAAPATSAPVATDQPITCANGTFTDEQSCSRNNIVTGCIKVDNCWKPKSATEVAQDDRNRCTSSYAASRSGCGAKGESPCTCGAYTACESGLSVSGGKCVNLAEEQRKEQEAVRKAAEQKLAEQRAAAQREADLQAEADAARLAQQQQSAQALANTGTCTSSGTYTCTDTGKKNYLGQPIFNRYYCPAAYQPWSPVGTCTEEQKIYSQKVDEFKAEDIYAKPGEPVFDEVRGGVSCNSGTSGTCSLGLRCEYTNSSSTKYAWFNKGVTSDCYLGKDPVTGDINLLNAHPLAQAAMAQSAYNAPIPNSDPESIYNPQNTLERILQRELEEAATPVVELYYDYLVKIYGKDTASQYINHVLYEEPTDIVGKWVHRCIGGSDADCRLASFELGGTSVAIAQVAVLTAPVAAQSAATVYASAETVVATVYTSAQIQAGLTLGALGTTFVNSPTGQQVVDAVRTIGANKVGVGNFQTNVSTISYGVSQLVLKIGAGYSAGKTQYETGITIPGQELITTQVNNFTGGIDANITTTGLAGTQQFSLTTTAEAALGNTANVTNLANDLTARDQTTAEVTNYLGLENLLKKISATVGQQVAAPVYGQ